MSGILITDNIMIAYKIQHYLKRKTQWKNGSMTLKLDMSKAYDHVEWSLLKAIMIKMECSTIWIKHIWIVSLMLNTIF